MSYMPVSFDHLYCVNLTKIIRFTHFFVSKMLHLHQPSKYVCFTDLTKDYGNLKVFFPVFPSSLLHLFPSSPLKETNKRLKENEKNNKEIDNKTKEIYDKKKTKEISKCEKLVRK